MKNFYLNFYMNQEDENTIQLISELEEFEDSLMEKENLEEPVANIYISSPGGENRVAAILYHFFNTSPFNYQFTINGDFSSNAFLILLALNPKYITIMRQCTSLIHLSNYNHPVSNTALNNPNHVSLNDYNDFKEYLTSIIELFKIFLTKEELAIIRQGGDICLPAKRVAILFQKLKKDKKMQQKAKELFEITL